MRTIEVEMHVVCVEKSDRAIRIFCQVSFKLNLVPIYIHFRYYGYAEM